MDVAGCGDAQAALQRGARIEVRKLGKAYIHNGQALPILIATSVEENIARPKRWKKRLSKLFK